MTPDQNMRHQSYLSHQDQRSANAQASLRICADLPEPSLFVFTAYYVDKGSD